MIIEVVNTGDELLLGHCVNTHLAYIGRKLVDLGLRVERQVCVTDGEEAIRAALEDAFGRADVVLVTGGLGPTSDDRTRDVTAGLLGRPMSEDPVVLKAIKRRLAVAGRRPTPACRRQAQVPDGALVLANPRGTAPGLYLPAAGGFPHVFLLPGPPRELYPMLEKAVLPRLQEIVGGGVPPVVRRFKLFGVGESTVAAELEAKLEALQGLVHGFQLEPGYVNVRCIGSEAALVEAAVLVRAVFGGDLVSDDDRSVEQVVVAGLKSRGEFVATAESCTGGLIASTLTDVPGASAVFRRGFVTYANEAKSDLLGVGPELLATHGAVSAEVASAMVQGCLDRSGDDHAVAVTGIAGPDGGTSDKPVGTVYVAVHSRGADGPEVARFFYPYERAQFKSMVCHRALDMLRRRL